MAKEYATVEIESGKVHRINVGAPHSSPQDVQFDGSKGQPLVYALNKLAELEYAPLQGAISHGELHPGAANYTLILRPREISNRVKVRPQPRRRRSRGPEASEALTVQSSRSAKGHTLYNARFQSTANLGSGTTLRHWAKPATRFDASKLQNGLATRSLP